MIIDTETYRLKEDHYFVEENEKNTKPARKIDTSTGKINTKLPISKNIQRID